MLLGDSPVNLMRKRILFIRTFKFLAAGGPVPPLGLLYIVSLIRRIFADRYELKLLDTGIGNLSIEDVKKEDEKEETEEIEDEKRTILQIV